MIRSGGRRLHCALTEHRHLECLHLSHSNLALVFSTMIVRLRRQRALGQPIVLVSIILVILVTASFLLRSQRYKSIQLSEATDFTKPPPSGGATTTQVHEVIHSDTEVDSHQEVPTQEEFEEESKELLE